MGKRLPVVLGIVPVVLAGFFYFSAQAAPSTSSSVTVVPPKFELWAISGKVIEDQSIKVINETNSEMSYSITTEDFTASGEEGNVALLDEGQENITFSLAKWLKASPINFTLGPKATQIVNFDIDVPKDAEPGGHYASIIINSSTKAKFEGAGASVNPRVASLVLLRVAGDVKEQASPISFAAPGYSEKGPIKFDLRVRNEGRNHIKPKGTILITNTLGRKVAEIPLSGENVLPGAIRKMSTEWRPEKGLAGRYTAALVANYGEKNDKSLSATVSFVVFPKYLAVFYGIGFLMVALVVTNRKQVKAVLHNWTK